MSSPSIAQVDEVQDLGQPQTLDEIGRELDALAIREVEATRIALECRVERAKLLRQVQNEHGFKGKRYIEFALVHGGIRARPIEQHKRNAATIAMPVPVDQMVIHLLGAGAEVISLGRPRWRHCVTVEPMPHPVPIVSFILRGMPRAANDNHPEGEPHDGLS